jgi:hypothetical protein
MLQKSRTQLNLRKVRKDTARIIKSIKKAFPEISESVDMFGGVNGSDSTLEMR